jgi:hypothetical protein
MHDITTIEELRALVRSELESMTELDGGEPDTEFDDDE